MSVQMLYLSMYLHSSTQVAHYGIPIFRWSFVAGQALPYRVQRLLSRCIDRVAASLADVRQRRVQQFWCEATGRIGISRPEQLQWRAIGSVTALTNEKIQRK